MVRWIVAGVLLALLIALLLMDELGGAPGPLGVATDAGAVADVTMGEVEEDQPHTDMEILPHHVVCQPLVQRLIPTKGEEWVFETGTKLADKHGSEWMIDFCKASTPLSEDEVVAKMDAALQP